MLKTKDDVRAILRQNHNILHDRATFSIYKNTKYIITGNANSIDCISFDKTCNVIFAVHGWLQNTYWPEMIKLQNTLQNTPECTYVVMVDYGFYSVNFHKKVRAVLPYVGENIARLMMNLNKCGIPFDNMTCVGFSLGAHCCANAGYGLEGKINTIYGLDAAATGYTEADSSNRINEGDAQRVILIRASKRGLQFSCGDVTFVAGNGLCQQVCKYSILGEFCSHRQAVTIFNQVWTNKVTVYMANNRTHCARLLDTEARGTFYFPTNPSTKENPVMLNDDCNYAPNYSC